MAQSRLKFFGWGREGEGYTPAEEAFLLGVYRSKFGVADFDARPVPGLDAIRLRAPRITIPATLAAFCTTDLYDRAAHTYGKSFPDTVRGLLGDYANAPVLELADRIFVMSEGKLVFETTPEAADLALIGRQMAGQRV